MFIYNEHVGRSIIMVENKKTAMAKPVIKAATEKPVAKAAEVKTEEPAKEVKPVAEKKTAAKKETVKKVAAKKETTKKAATKKATAKKEEVKATIIPTNSIISSGPVKTKPNFTSFKRLAPNITGIARKKVNSAATVLDTPIRRAPTIVAPERDVPGKIAANS